MARRVQTHWKWPGWPSHAVSLCILSSFSFLLMGIASSIVSESIAQPSQSILGAHQEGKPPRMNGRHMTLPWGLGVDELQRVFGRGLHSTEFMLAQSALQARAAWKQSQQTHGKKGISRQLSNAQVQEGTSLRGLQSTRELTAPLREEHIWPGYFIPEHERRMGISHPGDLGRLRSAFARYKSTGNLTVAIVGGSISAGAGAIDTHAWVDYLEDWMAMHLNGSHDLGKGDDPGRVHVRNGAVPGTFSSYMSVCYNIHVPQNADIIIVEYSVNDEQTLSDKLFDNTVRRPFERLLRSLLSYPKRPAVILLNAYTWFQVDDEKYNGMFYTGSDREFYELASYYQMPMLTIKGACWKLMNNNVTGFHVDRTRGKGLSAIAEPEEIDVTLRKRVFYYDVVHPDGWTGHRAMADLVITLFTDALRSLKKRPATSLELVRTFTPLPQPMIAGNWQSADSKCFIGENLLSIVRNPSIGPKFEWKNDQAPLKREKWGYIATEPGAKVSFVVDTMAAATPTVREGIVEAPNVVSVQIAYLKSYEKMGKAIVQCISGCTCKPSMLDGLHDARVSLVTLHEIVVTQAKECEIAVEVAAATSDPSGGTKVKLSGVMVADEKGRDSHKEKGLGVFTAMEYVSSGVGNGTFELKNTWR